MSLEAFLKLDGIDGDCQKDGHTGEIEILSFSWGAHHQSSVHTGIGSSTGKADFQEFSIMKNMDSSSPKLFLKTCDGKHIPSGKFVFRKASGDSKLEYLTYEMKEIFVTSVSQSASEGGADIPTESVSFSANQVVVTFIPQKADGSAGSKQQAGWDQGTNKAAAGA